MSSLLNDVTAMKEDQEREADLKVESWPLLFSLLFSTLFRCTSTAASRSDTSSVAFRCAFLFRNKQKRIADAAKTRREIRALEQRINKTKVDLAEFQAADTFMLEQEVVAERKQDLIKIQRVSSALPACRVNCCCFSGVWSSVQLPRRRRRQRRWDEMDWWMTTMLACHHCIAVHLENGA